jgi:hypothetical protein
MKTCVMREMRLPVTASLAELTSFESFETTSPEWEEARYEYRTECRCRKTRP